MKHKRRTTEGHLGELEELPKRLAEPTAVKSGRSAFEEAFCQSEETARVLLNATMNAALLMRPEGTLLALNEVATRRLGETAKELVGPQFLLSC